VAGKEQRNPGVLPLTRTLPHKGGGEQKATINRAEYKQRIKEKSALQIVHTPPAQVRPPPKAMSSTRSPGAARPVRIASSRAIGIEAAEVLP